MARRIRDRSDRRYGAPPSCEPESACAHGRNVVRRLPAAGDVNHAGCCGCRAHGRAPRLGGSRRAGSGAAASRVAGARI